MVIQVQFDILRIELLNCITNAEEQKKKKGPPIQILPNKQVFPLIGLGTYKITSEEVLTNILRKGIQVGFRHIDTARYYNNQIPLGKAIKKVIEQGRCKEKICLLPLRILTINYLTQSLELKQVLKLMQLKYVDLYYLHWPITDMDPSGKEWMHSPLPEYWAQMEECVRKGYTKHLGISNFNGQMIIELLSFAKIKPIALQIQCHPYLQQYPIVQISQKNGITVIAHTPQLGEVQQQNQLILDLSAKHGKTPAQIVLKTSLVRGIGVIPKTSNPQRLQQNFESWAVQLTDEDMKKVRAIPKNVRVSDGKAALFNHLCCFD